MATGSVETMAFASFARRILRAMARRVGDGDVESLLDLVTVCREADTALTHAVHVLRSEHGYSWAEIARPLGITRQAAAQRFGGEGSRTPGGQPAHLR